MTHSPSVSEAMRDVSDLPSLPLEEAAFWQDIHTPIAAALAEAEVASTAESGLYILSYGEVERCLKIRRFSPLTCWP